MLTWINRNVQLRSIHTLHLFIPYIYPYLTSIHTLHLCQCVWFIVCLALASWPLGYIAQLHNLTVRVPELLFQQTADKGSRPTKPSNLRYVLQTLPFMLAFAELLLLGAACLNLSANPNLSSRTEICTVLCECEAWKTKMTLTVTLQSSKIVSP